MDFWDGEHGLGEWLLMIAAMTLFWAAFVAVIVTVFRKVRDSRGPSEAGPGSTADVDKLLAARLARGEISEDEFRRGQELLHHTDTTA
jgi:uncharacterized membrane protein